MKSEWSDDEDGHPPRLSDYDNLSPKEHLKRQERSIWLAVEFLLCGILEGHKGFFENSAVC
jgi:hypothetical protein